MWSANETIFKKYNEDYKYDIYFSGVIRKEQTQNWRNLIYNNLRYLSKNIVGLRMNIQARFQKNNYIGKIFDIEDYAKNLSASKISITTTGPADLVGTRYFEIMATNKSLIICNRLENKDIYSNMFIEDHNCVMFSSIREFNLKILYYLKNEKQRMKIVNQA